MGNLIFLHYFNNLWKSKTNEGIKNSNKKSIKHENGSHLFEFRFSCWGKDKIKRQKYRILNFGFRFIKNTKWYFGYTDWIACKKIPCYMCDSAWRCFIVKKVKIFWSYVKHFWIIADKRKGSILIALWKQAFLNCPSIFLNWHNKMKLLLASFPWF